MRPAGVLLLPAGVCDRPTEAARPRLVVGDEEQHGTTPVACRAVPPPPLPARVMGDDIAGQVQGLPPFRTIGETMGWTAEIHAPGISNTMQSPVRFTVHDRAAMSGPAQGADRVPRLIPQTRRGLEPPTPQAQQHRITVTPTAVEPAGMIAPGPHLHIRNQQQDGRDQGRQLTWPTPPWTTPSGTRSPPLVPTITGPCPSRRMGTRQCRQPSRHPPGESATPWIWLRSQNQELPELPEPGADRRIALSPELPELPKLPAHAAPLVGISPGMRGLIR